MNKDMCVRCDEGVINIRVGAIIIKGNRIFKIYSANNDIKIAIN